MSRRASAGATVGRYGGGVGADPEPEQLFVGGVQAAAHLARQVHLHQRELDRVALEQREQVGG